MIKIINLPLMWVHRRDVSSVTLASRLNPWALILHLEGAIMRVLILQTSQKSCSIKLGYKLRRVLGLVKCYISINICSHCSERVMTCRIERSVLFCLYVCVLNRIWLFATRWLQPTVPLCPWDSPGQTTTGVGCRSLLLGIFLTQESNLRLLHCQANSLPLSRLRRPQFTMTYWAPRHLCTVFGDVQYKDEDNYFLRIVCLMVSMPGYYGDRSWDFSQHWRQCCNHSLFLLVTGDFGRWLGNLLLLFSREAVFNSATPWTAAHQASLSFTISQSLLRLTPTESVMPSNHLIFCHPLLLLSSVFPSIGVFSNELALRIRWSKYWRFSFSISHSNECPGLISFRMNWLDLLAVQGALKSLLQHHSSKASILWHLVLFMVQISCPYVTPGKTMALTIGIFLSKEMWLTHEWDQYFYKRDPTEHPCPFHHVRVDASEQKVYEGLHPISGDYKLSSLVFG